MIVKEEKSEVLSSGFNKSTKSTIAVNKHMMRLLSSGLYSDKISAIIRELSTNALDAMIENGKIKDKVFDVHLPTTLEPWFEIRDYGDGLDANGMENTFIVFGDSTKNNSNKFNGTFGLGSKAPLGYVRNFLITSIHNGIKTVYNYGKDEEDMPTLMEAMSAPSKEPSGLCIRVAVNSADVSTFVDRATSIYKYFENKPNVNIPLEYKVDDVDISGDNWKVLKNSGNSHIVMGNVKYPVPSKLLTNEKTKRILSVLHFRIDAKIGEVNMTPSRESLEADKTTQDFLDKVALDIEKGINKSIQAEFNTICTKESSEFMRTAHANRLLSKFSMIVNSLVLKYNNKRYNKINYTKDAKNLIDSVRLIRKANYYKRGFNETNVNEIYYDRFINNEQAKVLIVDDNKRINDICSHVLTSTDTKTLYVVRKKVLRDTSKTRFDSFLASIGNPPTVYASDIFPSLQTIVRKGTAITGLRGYRLYDNDAYKSSTIGSLGTLPNKQAGSLLFYTKFSGGQPLINCQFITYVYNKELLRYLNKEFKSDVKQIYGINKNMLELIQGNPEFICVDDYVDNIHFPCVSDEVSDSINNLKGLMGTFYSKQVEVLKEFREVFKHADTYSARRLISKSKYLQHAHIIKNTKDVVPKKIQKELISSSKRYAPIRNIRSTTEPEFLKTVLEFLDSK